VSRRVIFGLLCGALIGQAADLEQAHKLYNLSDFEGSLKALRELPQKDAAAYALLGQDYFMIGEYKKASEALEKALMLEPRNSDYAMWLGRAWGRRAETANPFSAMGQASKARQYFERAVELNPRNIDAWNDLLEYYTDAPGFLGGGMDKARAVVTRISEISAGEGYWAQYTLDEKRKEWSSAEEHLRRALELEPEKKIGRLIALARLLARQGRFQESDQDFARAEQLAPDNPRLWYAKAEVYVNSKRNLEVAKDLLKRYLTCTVGPEDPPKAKARKLLRQIEGG
jgi:tetratricopeptide (TPR) repeat protein